MKTPTQDLYAILGLSRQASQDEIGHAYRALLRRYHPDTRATADPTEDARSDATLRTVLAAYAVLGDPSRRAEYDLASTPRPDPPGTGAPGPARRRAAGGQPPIVVGPVRWHPGPARDGRRAT